MDPAQPSLTAWDELVSELAADDLDLPTYPRALLARVQRAVGAGGAALYCEEDSGLSLEVAAGQGAFPPRLEATLPPGLTGLPVPNGRLLLAGATAAALPGLAELADAGALAIYSRLTSLKRHLKRREFEASLRDVQQQALYDVGLAITSMLDLGALSEGILSWAVSLLDARRAALYLIENDEYRLRHALGGEAQPRLATAEAAELGAAILPGATHLLRAPIEIDGRPRGLIVVGDKESRRGVGPFGEADERTLQLFASQAAIALENARLHRQALEKQRLEREVELAGEIQRQILPKVLPELPGLEVAGWNRPARHIGGDYYTFIPRGTERLIFGVADVSGKGMPAALLVSTLHSALRLTLDQVGLGSRLVEKLNRHILDTSSAAKYITLLLAELELETLSLTYVNAGHNPGVVLDRTGAVRHLPSTGPPVGLLPAATFQEATLDLAPGDLVCIYSDGITEAANRRDEEFGLARLIETLLAHRAAPLADIIRALDETTTCFAEGQAQGDDQTVLLLRVSSA